ncbi:MAG TPA: esterase-like activity of phytase family protein [Pseudonocardiaceae bacterium]
MLRRVLPALLAGTAALALSTPATAASAVSFQVLGEVPVPGGLTFDGATFGGLSGVDYDTASGTWRAISNDGSNHGPARFYDLNLGTTGTALQAKVSANSASSCVSGGQVDLLRADGTQYPPTASAGADTVAPEAIRYDPTTKNVFWANQGVNNSSLSVDPAVRESGATDGKIVTQLTVPTSQKSAGGVSGIRDGEGMSGFTFAPNGLLGVSTVAGPLVQDGPNPTATAGAYTRITGQSRLFGFAISWQYAYPLDALPLTDANGNGTNLVSDILSIDTTHYLVMETATAPGKGYSVRVYEVDDSSATSVRDVPALAGKTFTPVTKTLLLDMSTLNLQGGVANFSGLTWGPTLSNGDRSLVFVSDNGFNSQTPTQVLALDVHGI